MARNLLVRGTATDLDKFIVLGNVEIKPKYEYVDGERTDKQKVDDAGKKMFSITNVVFVSGDENYAGENVNIAGDVEDIQSMFDGVGVGSMVPLTGADTEFYAYVFNGQLGLRITIGL